MADLMQMLVAVVEGAMASWCWGRGGVSEWEVEGEGDDHCLAELLDSRTFGHHDLQYMYLGCVPDMYLGTSGPRSLVWVKHHRRVKHRAGTDTTTPTSPRGRTRTNLIAASSPTSLAPMSANVSPSPGPDDRASSIPLR